MSQEKITFANHFHNTSVTIRVRDGSIAGSTARRIARALCGLKSCTCGNGICDTRSNAGGTWIYSDDGEMHFDEEPSFDSRGRLTSVDLVPRW